MAVIADGKVTGSNGESELKFMLDNSRNCSSRHCPIFHFLQVWSSSLYQRRSLTNCREVIDFKFKMRRLDERSFFLRFAVAVELMQCAVYKRMIQWMIQIADSLELRPCLQPALRQADLDSTCYYDFVTWMCISAFRKGKGQGHALVDREICHSQGVFLASFVLVAKKVTCWLDERYHLWSVWFCVSLCWPWEFVNLHIKILKILLKCFYTKYKVYVDI